VTRFSAAGYRRALAAAMVLLGLSALTSSVTQALSARSSASDRAALADALDEQRDENQDLRDQLDCRYILSADVSRLQAEVFVTVSQALAAATRRQPDVVALYVAHLDYLAGRLDEANLRRDEALGVCVTEPENVLG
jgi:hypothetical protein